MSEDLDSFAIPYTCTARYLLHTFSDIAYVSSTVEYRSCIRSPRSTQYVLVYSLGEFYCRRLILNGRNGNQF
jgi:hypothetical protein